MNISESGGSPLLNYCIFPHAIHDYNCRTPSAFLRSVIGIYVPLPLEVDTCIYFALFIASKLSCVIFNYKPYNSGFPSRNWGLVRNLLCGMLRAATACFEQFQEPPEAWRHCVSLCLSHFASSE
jgi:hypothetical protein